MKYELATPKNYCTIIPARGTRRKIMHTMLEDAQAAVEKRLVRVGDTDQWMLDSHCMIYGWDGSNWDQLYKFSIGTLKSELPWRE